MPLYKFTISVPDIYIEVEADTEDEATQIASEDLADEAANAAFNGTWWTSVEES